MSFHHTGGEAKAQGTKVTCMVAQLDSAPWWPIAWPVPMLRTGPLAMTRPQELPSQDRNTWLEPDPCLHHGWAPGDWPKLSWTGGSCPALVTAFPGTTPSPPPPPGPFYRGGCQHKPAGF